MTEERPQLLDVEVGRLHGGEVEPAVGDRPALHVVDRLGPGPGRRADVGGGTVDLAFDQEAGRREDALAGREGDGVAPALVVQAVGAVDRAA